MDLRQLRALVGVADHGSFSGAADALHTVQSNVSTHVARLERELRVTLWDRSQARLTPEGEAVVARARRIEAELEAAVADVAALRHEVVGTARAGMIGTTARWLVPRLLDLGAARHPGLRLEVSEGSSVALEGPLLAGQLDLVVGAVLAPDADVHFTPLFEEELVLVVPANDARATAGPLHLADLSEVPMLLPLPGTAFRAELDRALAEAEVGLTVRAEVDGVRLLASLTFDGHGPAILPASARPSYLADRWALVPILDLPPRRVGIARRRRGHQTVAGNAAAQLVTELTSPSAALPEGLRALPRAAPTHPPGARS
jgi:DNA-binding transcriptional LysR family regulator